MARTDAQQIREQVAQDIGANVSLQRKIQGWSMDQLGGYSGMTREAVRAIEAGEQIPRGETLMKLASAFSCTVEDLLPEDYATVYDPQTRVTKALQGRSRRRKSASKNYHPIPA